MPRYRIILVAEADLLIDNALGVIILWASLFRIIGASDPTARSISNPTFDIRFLHGVESHKDFSKEFEL